MRSARSIRFDPTVYPEYEKDRSEELLKIRIVELLRPLVDRWLRQRGVRALVGASQFIYYRQHTPTLRVCPDLYLLPGLDPDVPIPLWKTWGTGIAPSFALHIVPREIVWDVEYGTKTIKYGESGVRELVIFDPYPEQDKDRVRWQVYRRGSRKRFAIVEYGGGDRVRSKALGCFVRAVATGSGLRLRLGTGLRGDELFPTS